ncbi:MAG: His-Xaa-Ser system radical SAM maturase HxsC [Mangrovibacterium sp.]
MDSKLNKMDKVFSATSVNLPEREFIGRVEEIDLFRKQIRIIDPLESLITLITTDKPSGSRYFAHIEESEFPLFKVGDIIEFDQNKRIEIHFSEDRNDNALFITEKCNCNCLSCPQPPRKGNDYSHFFHINQQVIKLLDQNCKAIGITGGEPLVAGKYFLQTLNLINERLPSTELQILTNGILLGSKEFFNNLKSYINSEYYFGIPLYSDFPDDHDWMMNHKGAFYKTIRGLYNLADTTAKIEIRVLLNLMTMERIKELCSFIFKNLPFVSHVAFMGLENIGNAIRNWKHLKVDYTQVMDNLEQSIDFLARWNIPVSIYNVPLCHLSTELHQFSAMSISDWKRIYLKECDDCSLKQNCGGLFKTSKSNYEVCPL